MLRKSSSHNENLGWDKEMEERMDKIVAKYPQIFSGIGWIKVDLIHIYLKDYKEKPIIQKQRPVVLHLIELLKSHLKELVEGDVI